jgi:hypothetical protein
VRAFDGDHHSKRTRLLDRHPLGSEGGAHLLTALQALFLPFAAGNLGSQTGRPEHVLSVDRGAAQQRRARIWDGELGSARCHQNRLGRLFDF